MIHASTLPMGEKIKQIRKAKGLSQENLAKALGCSVAAVSRMESGEVACSDEMLVKIRTYMGLENAPLLDYERGAFESKLLAWNEMLNENRVDEAKASEGHLSAIMALPFEHDLALLYSMLSVRLILKEGNSSVALKKMEAAELLIDGASTEVRHLFYRNKGYMASLGGEVKRGAGYFLQALDIGFGKLKADPALFYLVGSTFLYQGKVMRAITYFEQADKMYNRSFTNHSASVVKSVLVGCYLLINELELAEKLASEALSQTQLLDHTSGYAFALLQTAAVYQSGGDSEKALEYIERGLTAAAEGKLIPTDYTEAVFIGLYQKAGILLKRKNFDDLEKVLEQWEALANDANGFEAYSIMLKTFRHFVNLNNSTSVDYIENTAIPSLMMMKSLRAMELARWICDELEAYYRKKKSDKKANAIAAKSRDIYKSLLCGMDSIG